MIAMLLWHVQIFLAIYRPEAEPQINEIPIDFDLNCVTKFVSEMGPAFDEISMINVNFTI